MHRVLYRMSLPYGEMSTSRKVFYSSPCNPPRLSAYYQINQWRAEDECADIIYISLGATSVIHDISFSVTNATSIAYFKRYFSMILSTGYKSQLSEWQIHISPTRYSAEVSFIHALIDWLNGLAMNSLALSLAHSLQAVCSAWLDDRRISRADLHSDRIWP